MADRPKPAERLLTTNPFLRATVENTNQALASTFGIKAGFSLDQSGRGALPVRFRPQRDVNQARRGPAAGGSLLFHEARRASLPFELFAPATNTPCVRVGRELLVSETWAQGLQAPVSADLFPQLVSASQSMFFLLSETVLETAPKPRVVTDFKINAFYASRFIQEIADIAKQHPKHEMRFDRLVKTLKVLLSTPDALSLQAQGSRLALKLDGKTVTEQFMGDDYVATGLLTQEASGVFIELMNKKYPMFGKYWGQQAFRQIRSKDKERARYTIDALLKLNPQATVFGLYISSTLGTVNADFTAKALAARIAREEEESRPIKLTSLARLADVFGVTPIDEVDADVSGFDYANYSDADSNSLKPDPDIDDSEDEAPTWRRRKPRPKGNKLLE